MTARATVVVVTWQGQHLLGPCLDALAAQTLGPEEVDVVVVDNASTDGTAELLASYRDVRVVTAPRNLGFAGGATLGLADVSTPYAVMLNNDAAPDPDWLERLLAGFSDDVAAVTSKVVLEPRYVLLDVAADPHDINRVTAAGSDVTTAVVARRTPRGTELAVPAPDDREVVVVVEGSGRTELLRTAVAATAPRVDVLNSTGGVLTPTGHGADRGYLEVDRGQYDDQPDVFAVCGAAAAFRTDVAAAAGWFDPWLFAYYEDLDLSWRLRRAGWQVRYEPDARVRHRHAATSRVGSDLFLFHNRRNRLAVLARNASLPQLGRVLAASRRPRPTPTADLLRATDARPAGPAARGKVSALASFAARLPRLLLTRTTRGMPRPKPSGDAGSSPLAVER